MTHKMGLAQFVLADKNIFTSKKYLDKVGSNYNYVWVEDSTVVHAHSSRTFSTNVAYAGSSSNYYYVVKESTNTNFSATNENPFPYSDEPDNSWSESNVNIGAGQYRQITKTPAITCSVISKHTLAIGDIMYTDGALSSSHTGSIHRSPVGIVFYLGSNSTPMSSYDTNLGFTHGYVMALKDCDNRSEGPWGSGEANYTLVNGESEAINYADEATQVPAVKGDMNGLKHCNDALSGPYASLCTAIIKAKAHTPAMPTTGSAVTSGWYLPSSGQMFHWVVAFSNGWITNETAIYQFRTNFRDFCYMSPDADGTEEKGLTTRVRLAMNAYMTGKGLTAGTEYTAFTKSNYFWSSTERIVTCAFMFYFYENGFTVWPGTCGNNSAEPKEAYHRRYTKSVLAF